MKITWHRKLLVWFLMQIKRVLSHPSLLLSGKKQDVSSDVKCPECGYSMPSISSQENCTPKCYRCQAESEDNFPYTKSRYRGTISGRFH